MQTLSDTPTISIRGAAPSDSRTVMRLAALDSAPVPLGPVLLAEVDGEPKAALALRDGRVVADPFARTAELVQLLQVHAAAVEQADAERTATRSFGMARRFGLAA
jgi:hypothetical protein